MAALFEADDPLLAECGAKVMARAGRLMLEACRAAKKEVPAEVGASQDLDLCQQVHQWLTALGADASLRVLLRVHDAPRLGSPWVTSSPCHPGPSCHPTAARALSRAVR